MRFLTGIIRLLLFMVDLVVGTAVVVVAAWWPGKVKGVRPAAWVVHWVCRIAVKIFGVAVTCPEPARLAEHQGFLFANHNSYFDIIVLLSLLPVRFVAKAEVRAIPFIGRMASSFGCVFVKRESKESRAQARAELGEVEHYPAIAIFPEGKTNLTAEPLLPFRYGAFEIAAQYRVPYLPCAIVYNQPELVRAGSNKLAKSAWRLASNRTPLTAWVIPLETVYPKPGDNSVDLAEETHQAMTAVLERGKTPPPRPSP